VYLALEEDPEEVILDQLSEGESFWLKGDV